MRARITSASLLLWLAGCSPDFENVTLVKDLRILGVQADPSEILVETIDPASTPEPFPPIKLHPLVVDPNGLGRAVHYKITACGNQVLTNERGGDRGPSNARDTVATGPCPANAPVVAEGEAAGDRRNEAAIEVTVKPTLAMLRALFGIDVGQVLAQEQERLIAAFGFDGIPVRFDLTVTAGAERDEAIKRVVFYPRLTADQQPNQNPTLTEVRYRKSPSELVIFDPRDPPEVVLGGSLELRPTIEGRESYVALVRDRQTGKRQVQMFDHETYRYAFFASAGTFSPAQINSEPLEVFTKAPEFRTTYHAPRAFPPDGRKEADIWIVVRDERAGTSFYRMTLPLVLPIDGGPRQR